MKIAYWTFLTLLFVVGVLIVFLSAIGASEVTKALGYVWPQWAYGFWGGFFSTMWFQILLGYHKS